MRGFPLWWPDLVWTSPRGLEFDLCGRENFPSSVENCWCENFCGKSGIVCALVFYTLYGSRTHAVRADFSGSLLNLKFRGRGRRTESPCWRKTPRQKNANRKASVCVCARIRGKLCNKLLYFHSPNHIRQSAPTTTTTTSTTFRRLLRVSSPLEWSACARVCASWQARMAPSI